jgi:glutamate N-acetyltransferase / amino-acid N-acetyltransferase
MQRLSRKGDGLRSAHDEAKVSAAMKEQTITLKVALGLGRGRVLTCDLSKEYVAINGDYRS